jgi:ribonucleoside-diphosphate reductase alpha chain
MDAMALLTSIALQYGVPLSTLTDKLKNTRFEPSGMTHNPAVPTATSLVDYIFRYLEQRFVTGSQTQLPFAQTLLPLMPAANGYHSGEATDEDDGADGRSGHANGFGKGGAQAVLSGVGCPECGSVLHYAEGCLMCRGCGYSKCG